MHFLAQITLNGDDVTYIITANSWSNCLSYLEGTGGDIVQIIKLGDTTSVVLNTPSTTNCYNVALKDVNTQQRFNYVVFENSFTGLQNWISQQTDKQVTSIQFSEKTYVNV